MAATSPTCAFRRSTAWRICYRRSPRTICRWWRFAFRKSARSAAASATLLKEFGKERGLRVFDDPEAPGSDSPDAMAAVRGRIGAQDDDLLLIAGWAGDPKGQRPEETVLQACGHLRLHAAQKYAERHKLFDPQNFQFLWVTRFSDVRMGRRRPALECGAPSVHIGATTTISKS